MVRDAGPDKGTPGPCRWSPSNATVDSHGHLHVRISQSGGKWFCTEIHSLAPTGYGTYTFTVLSDLRSLDPSVVLGLFTYDTSGRSAGNSEIDIEATRWGIARRPGKNATYSVQPTDPDPTHRQRAFALGPPPYTARFVWTPTQVNFTLTDGDGNPHRFTGTHLPGAPASTTHAYINLWLFHSKAPRHPLDITVGSFGYARAIQPAR